MSGLYPVAILPTTPWVSTTPHADIKATGRAVLSIWNARVNEALDEHEDMRIAVLLRNIDTREFVLFEDEALRFVPDNYQWEYTRGGNLRALNKMTGQHEFTWQFHGAQFTVFRDVPASARRFIIKQNVPIVEPSTILAYVRFKEDWIEIVG